MTLGRKSGSEEKAARVAVVTGANRGLGYEACRQLARAGLRVVLTARNEEAGRRAASDLAGEGLSVEFLKLDVADPASIEEFFRELETRYQRADVLINNAGVMIDVEREGDHWTMSDATVMKARRETLRRTMEVNVYGALELTQKLVPLMKKNEYGRIVNLSSGMGQLSDMDGGWAAYRISKAGINAVTRIFSSELQGTNIKINSVSPGWVRTRMGGESAPLSPELGVRTIVQLATLPDDGPSGGFFDEDGDRMEW